MTSSWQKIKNLCGRRFRRDEDAAITVDWVVLTAALVAIAVIGLNIIRPGVIETASAIYDDLTAVSDNF